MSALIVLRMRSNSPLWLTKKSSSPVASIRFAPRASASDSFRRVRESTVSSAPMAAAIWTPVWPGPPRTAAGGGGRVEDEVESAVVADDAVLLAGGEHPLRPEGARLGFLPQSAGEHGDLGAHGRGDLDAHVAEPAEADDGDLLGRPVVLLAGSPAGQRLIGGDARAQQRGGDVEVEGVGDPADEAFA